MCRMYLLAVSWAVLGVGLPLIGLSAVAVWRRPLLAVYATVAVAAIVTAWGGDWTPTLRHLAGTTGFSTRV